MSCLSFLGIKCISISEISSNEISELELEKSRDARREQKLDYLNRQKKLLEDEKYYLNLKNFILEEKIRSLKSQVNEKEV